MVGALGQGGFEDGREQVSWSLSLWDRDLLVLRALRVQMFLVLFCHFFRLQLQSAVLDTDLVMLDQALLDIGQNLL